jgi:phenylpropionate dioxygenase-like ring-hydroxylating dioxygenase large terminal subunit
VSGGSPFPLPQGWFIVAWSDELAPGAVQALRYFGRELVLFRTEAGQAALFDAHCPHLGAHLGHGGRVVGESIECPFHAWRFDACGACIDVPYARRRPAAARARAWPLVERNGALFAWHHRRGEPPSWEVPELPEYADAGWSAWKRFRWTVRAFNQELGENTIDRAHFPVVHGTRSLPESQVETHGHELHSLQRARMQTPRGVVDGAIHSIMRGFGCSTTRFSGICETLLLSSITPIDDQSVDARFAFSVDTARGYDSERGVGAAIIADVKKQFDEDIPIWENKVYRERPLLCDGDGPIAQFRRWAQQFYA